ncbi:MAG TPA: TIGR03435 family protein [Acidobacteriaceae bacterium]|nr:TIGR03435 family protein [Acidobacteriaceae bacterium]
MKSLKTMIAVIGLALAAGPIAFAQSAASAEASAKLPEFEVVTLKPTDHTAGVMHLVGVQLTKDQLTMNATTLKGLICVAYAIPYWELAGGEPWMDKEYYDFVAKLPQGENSYNLRHGNYDIADKHIRKMMQAMLAERFQLRFHRETKMGTISILEQSGKPLLLVQSQMQAGRPDGDGFGGVGAVEGKGVGIYNSSMPQFAHFLSGNILHHPVIDKTGLIGGYDFQSKTIVTAEDIRSGNTTSMWAPAIREMGLKLREATGPVETFVIDHAERPSAN